MVMITLYRKTEKETQMYRLFRLWGRRWGWDVLREQHWNKYTIKGETDHQSRLEAWDGCSGLVHWEDQRDGMEREVGGGIGMGNTCKSMAYSCQCMAVNPWLIHVNVWQKPLKYCKVVSLQWIKINEKKKKKTYSLTEVFHKQKAGKRHVWGAMTIGSYSISKVCLAKDLAHLLLNTSPKYPCTCPLGKMHKNTHSSAFGWSSLDS